MSETLLDTRGSLCPQPIIDLAKAMKTLPAGARLVILNDDAAFPLDVEAWCRSNRHSLVELTSEGRLHRAVIDRRDD